MAHIRPAAPAPRIMASKEWGDGLDKRVLVGVRAFILTESDGVVQLREKRDGYELEELLNANVGPFVWSGRSQEPTFGFAKNGAPDTCHAIRWNAPMKTCILRD
jgi:hypothetical protein